MFGNGGRSVWELADFVRPAFGPAYSGELAGQDLRLSGKVGWSSNGGPGKGHPARALPSHLEIPVTMSQHRLRSLVLVGVFARWASGKAEPPRTVGASIQIGPDDGGYRLDLLNGVHYRDAFDLTPLHQVNGDGTSLETIGVCELDGAKCRVDALTVDLNSDVDADTVHFRDLGTPASFTLFDLALGWEAPPGCPFHSGQGGVPLSELGAVIRLRDRVRFKKAVEQLDHSIRITEDLDEARGEALTFIAVATAATLELGAPRSMHRLQLEAARRLDQASNTEAILEEAKRLVEVAVGTLFEQGESANDRLMDRALSIVERQFAKPLTDVAVADQLGLSPSHFRYLFRQTDRKSTRLNSSHSRASRMPSSA